MGFSSWKNNSKPWKASPSKHQNDVILFGLRPITIVAATVALVQGMNQIADLSINYLYKDDFGFSPVQVSFIFCLTGLPWMIKPVWGLISDNVTFFGYRRKSYLILWGSLQFFYYFSIATWVHNKWLGVLMLVLIQVCIAFNNVIGEALLVESAQEIQAQELVSEEQKQAEASKNVSLFFGVKYVGVISTAYLSGYLLEYIGKHAVFLIAGTLPLLVVAVGVFIMREKRRNATNRREVPYQDIPSHPFPNEESTEDSSSETDRFRYEGAETDVELHSELNIYTIQSKNTWRRIVEFVRKPAIFRPIVFLLLFMITPTSQSTMFYFYTNSLGFAPNFMGKLKFANSIACLLGVYLYNKYLKNIRFDKLLFWSTLLCVALGSTQILLVLRWNKYLGIPDKLFCIGDSVIIESIGEVNYVPVLVLACRMCPKDMEGTMYALLMATLSLGGMISSQLGGIIAYFLGITSTNFDKLWILVVITNVSLLVPLPFLRMINYEHIVKEMEQGTSWLKARTRRET